MTGPRSVYDEARAAAASLGVLRGVLDDDAGRLWLDLIEGLAAPSPDPSRLAASYGRLFAVLASEIELASEPPAGDAWQHHVAHRPPVSDRKHVRVDGEYGKEH